MDSVAVVVVAVKLELLILPLRLQLLLPHLSLLHQLQTTIPLSINLDPNKVNSRPLVKKNGIAAAMKELVTNAVRLVIFQEIALLQTR